MKSIIRASNINGVEYVELLNKLQKNEIKIDETEFKMEQECLLWFRNILYIPNISEIEFLILNEMQKHAYVGHPRYQKIITPKTILLAKFKNISNKLSIQMFGMSRG